MRTLWVVAAVCAMSLATEGCKHNKREPVPGPQVGTAAFRWAEHAGPGGIAWFQGSVEEAFARADLSRSARQNTLHCARARKRPPAA